MNKLFSELTKDEATAIVRQIVNSSNSEEEIRRRLTDAGFNGYAAAVNKTRSGPVLFMAMVHGPKDTIIVV